MSSLCIKISISTITLLLPAVAGLRAQPTVSTTRLPAPLGLLRLQDTAKPGQAAPLAPARFTVDYLSAGAVVGANNARKDDVEVLMLDAGKEWSRPLRGSASDVVFVSFELYASHSTVVEIGGIRLSVITSPIAGSFQLAYDDSATSTPRWRALNTHFGAEQFGGRLLAMLPVLTVRIDPAAGVWDMFSGSRLLADNLPLIARTNSSRQFLIQAGSSGAWLSGLVMSDENPLYVDENANGIDDRFEQEKRGNILAANASVVERQQLAAQWKQSPQMKRPPAMLVKRPMPDGTVIPVSPGK